MPAEGRDWLSVDRLLSPEQRAIFDTPNATHEQVEERTQEAPAVAAEPDPAFNGKRAVFSSFRGEPSGAEAVCVQRDGRIVVAGTVGPSRTRGRRRMAVARYLPDGRLDEGFGARGWAIVDIRGADDAAHAAVLQADGKLVVAGHSLDPAAKTVDFALVRLDEDGMVDKSFSGRGVALTGFVGASTARARSAAIDDDGRIVVAGDVGAGMGLARYKRDGTLDHTFAEDGRVIIGSEENPARAYAVGIQSTGEIVMAGCARPAGRDLLAVVRCDTDGQIDSSFGTDGAATIELAADAAVYAAALQRDGRIVIAGGTGTETRRICVLQRLDPDGQLDETFESEAGRVAGEVKDLVIQPDGAILAAGYQIVGKRDSFALARYRGDGRLDALSRFNMGGIIDRASAIAVDKEGRILLAGTTRMSRGKSEFALARLLANDSAGASATAPKWIPDEAAARRSEQRAALDSARELEWSGETDEAEAAYRDLAEADYIDATFALHLTLRNHAEARDEALFWLLHAARQIDLLAPGSLPPAMSDALERHSSVSPAAAPWSDNDPAENLDSLGDAYFDLGLIFIRAGRAAEGEGLLEEAAEMGYAPAEFQWGLMLLDRHDTAEAERWIRRAAVHGDDEAAERLRDFDRPSSTRDG